MISFSLAVIIGTALAFWGNSLSDAVWIGFLPFSLLLAWIRPDYRFLFNTLSVFLWSTLLLQLSLEHRLSEEFDGAIFQLTGTVTDITEQRPHSSRFYLIPDHIDAYPNPMPRKIRLNWYRSDQMPQSGQRWQLEVKLRRPRGFRNPGAFDYERWLFVKGIDASGYVRQSSYNRKLEDAGWFQIDHYRLQMYKAIEQACANCRHDGLFKALAIGFRGDIPANQASVLRETGTAHLLAISGLHIGLVAGLFYLLGRYLWRYLLFRSGLNRLECSVLLGLGAAIGYAALAGFSIPTVRALVMLAVVCFALLLRRNINLLNSIACAICLILLVDPLAIGSASFWLSISALLVIAFGQFLIPQQRGWIQKLLQIQLLFSVLFVAIGLILFDQASSAGFLANIIAIPVLSFVILPATLFASLLSVLYMPLATQLFGWLDQLTGWLVAYLQMLLDAGLSSFSGGDRPLLLMVCLVLGIILVLLPTGWRSRFPGILLLSISIFWQPDDIESGQYRLTALDVGMGTSVVVETRHNSLIYDFGPGREQGFSAGAWVVKPYLQYRNIKNPDMMIISHVDSDHSGGFISFVGKQGMPMLLSGTPQEVQDRFGLNESVKNCHAYPAWSWDGVRFEFLSQVTADDLQSSNNRSCVLKVSGFHSTLLTGDIESEQESRLIEASAEKLAAEAVLVPHHGSLTSSSEALIAAMKPDLAIFTVGNNNRWGFPKKAVVKRYQLAGARQYRTDRNGAVTLLSSLDGLHISTSRQSRRLWQ